MNKDEKMIRTNNPFYINPATIPENYIPRTILSETIISAFTQEIPSEYAKYIVGVRGTGKTVLMNYVCEQLEKQGFINVRLNPMLDLYDSAIEGLRLHETARNTLYNMKFSFEAALPELDLFGKKTPNVKLGMSFELNKLNNSTKEGILRELVSKLSSKDKRVLFSIDEVYKCDNLATFAQTMTTMTSVDRSNVFILMTGLPDNIKDVKTDRRSSFLARILEVETSPLSDTSVISAYKSVFDIDREQAKELASYVKGYSYGFQLLGYILWSNNKTKIDENVLDEYQDVLFSSQYDLIWESLTPKEKEAIIGVAKAKTDKTADILEATGMTPESFNQLRRILSMQKKILNVNTWGHVTFVLPLFKEYVISMI